MSESVTVSAVPRGSVWRYWDKGGDLGTSWRATTFSDASWSSGAGPLGFGETYLATNTTAGPITTYFRHTFTVDDPTAITAITAEVMFDDGFVVYLNGLEIGRDFMPTGTVSASTRALDHEAVNTYKVFDWSHHADVLVAGTNTLAVEVHQASSTSSDLVFDLGLSMQTGAPPPPDADAWFYWDNDGDLGTSWRTLNGPAAGWDLGDGPLGYGESYIVTPTAPGHITTYFRRTLGVDEPERVSSIEVAVMYDDGYVAYLNGVEIQRAAMPTGTITATTRSSGHEAEQTYETFTVPPDLLIDGDNVFAFEVHQVSSGSSDLVFDAQVRLDFDVGPAPEPLASIEPRAHWRLWDCTTTPPSNWMSPEFFDSCWSSRGAPIGYGESYLATTIERGGITEYFYNELLLDNPSLATGMFAEVMYDDGYVMYLNGVEIARRAMPTGTVTSTTRSTGHEANNTYERIELDAFTHLLEPGFNRVSVEVHQASSSSSDLVFDLSLRVFGSGEDPPPPPTGEDIARGSTWSYWDGEDPGYFASNSYNDVAWQSGAGPLGYGESYLGTTTTPGEITTYFRRWFTVDDPTVKTTLMAELMYDDGVIVHLNGTAIQHLLVPQFAEHDTRATGGHEASNRYETFDWSAASGLLVDGPNLLAVEVHQVSSTSSDLVFDLSLQVESPPVCAVPNAGPANAPEPDTFLGEVWVTPTTAYVIGASWDEPAFGRRSASGEWCWSKPIDSVRWHAIWGTGEVVWLVGTGGTVSRYDGTSFTLVDVGTSETLTDIWGTSEDDIWIVGARGTVRHFDGTSWTAHDLEPHQSLMGVWSASRDDVWVTGRQPYSDPDPELQGGTGLIFRWDPATASWDLEHSNTMEAGDASYRDIHGTSATNVWVLGSDHPRGAACSIDTMARYDGTRWAHFPNPTECGDLRTLAVGAPGARDGAWVGGGFETFDFESGAWRFTEEKWEHVPAPPEITGLHHDGDRLYATAHDGYLRGGQSILRWDGSAWIREW